jgi:2,4-dienoyl-CoA reductase-like NADH-dependent reductase (Old Yellow Enzyme family)
MATTTATGAATRFEHLLAPGEIGGLTLRNRILMCPMGDSLCETDGSISQNQAAYFEARARGGAALLLVGSVSISYPDACFDERQTAASDDRYLPGLSDLCDRVHRHGARIAAQLVHNGQLALLDVARGRPMLVPSAPKASNPDRFAQMVTPDEVAAMMSPYTQPTSKVEYREATEADLAEVVQRFSEAADRCVRAGFDAIELHAGHGYLLDEFLTPAMNKRTDGWGGDLAGRARLLLEVLRTMRARLPQEIPIWVRVNALEVHKDGGERFEEQLEVMAMCADAGAAAIHVTAYHDTDVATGPTDSYAPHTVGPLQDYAAQVRQRVSVPVISMGRYEPDEAEAVLAQGKADFIAMGRKLLADPDLPNKLAEGRVDDVRPCIYQYRCIGNIFVKESLHCVANARTGREHDLPERPTEHPRRVLVVGGGAGGLEAARVLAGHGHQVQLWEAGERLGGMLVHAARADALLDRYLGWITGQVERSGVEVALGRRATADAVTATGAEVVVVATGGQWGRSTFVGADLPLVRSVPELGPWLADDGADVGGRVAIVGGGKAATSIAGLCLRRGREVAVIEPSGVLCQELGLPGRWRLVPDLDAAGARLVLGVPIVRIAPGGVVVVAGDDAEELVGADTVIVTSDVVPDDELAIELGGLDDDGVQVHRVGDCAGVRRIEGANLDVAELAVALA